MSPEQTFDRRSFIRKAALIAAFPPLFAASEYHQAQEQKALIPQQLQDTYSNSNSPVMESSREERKDELEQQVIDKKIGSILGPGIAETAILLTAAIVYQKKQQSLETTKSPAGLIQEPNSIS